MPRSCIKTGRKTNLNAATYKLAWSTLCPVPILNRQPITTERGGEVKDILEKLRVDNFLNVNSPA